MANENTLSAQARLLWGQVQATMNSLGFDTVLTSAGRSASHNAGIPGASSTSQHIGGNAFDFVVKDDKGRRVDPLIVQATLANGGFNYGQNIAEYGLGMGPRNHLSVPTARHQGQNLLARDGKYTPNRPDLGRSLADKGRDQVKGIIAKAMGNMGLLANPITGPAVAGVIAGGAAAEEVKTGLQSWLLRGSMGILAILLIAAAVFALSRGEATAVIKSAIK